MIRGDLYRWFDEGPLILDGATGSNLQRAGMPPGVCPELWILDHPQVLVDLQKSFIGAGTRLLYAPTFSGNRIKLAEYGVADRLSEINKELVALSRRAVSEMGAVGRVLVAGDLTMTGVPLAPVGPMQIEELIDIYKEQVTCLVDAGVDLFVVETMMSLAETRAAVIAIKEVCDLPIMASMTFQADGRSLYGTDPVTALVVLQSLGADIVGINCSTGPMEMLPFVRKMKEYANVPLMVKPNAGLPVLVDGNTVYPMGAEEFASFGPAFVEAGAALLGGCCGTTPEHIRLLAERVKGMVVKPPCNIHPSVLASERRYQEVRLDGPFLVIGERINPTGKKRLSEELRLGKLDLVEEFALTQEAMGAHILDVNMGTNGIDEKEMMLAAIERLSMVTDLPLCIDTSYVEVMEAALRAYPGRALINSISMEEKKVNELLPLAKKYGAMFILLPLSDKGLPESLDEKISYIEEIKARAEMIGIGKEDIIVDGLVTTVGANKKAALETLSTIRYCRRELGMYTTVGLSNISFGLPERSYINGAFAAMAIAEGLTMAIANPSNNLLMGISYGSDLLMDKEDADIAYIEQVRIIKENTPAGGAVSSSGGSVAGAEKTFGQSDVIQHKSDGGKTDLFGQEASNVFQAVLKGKKKNIVDLVKIALKAGSKPREILDDVLIPAINEVGRLFDDQIYFLPQLISSANAMKEAISYLEPLLQDGEEAESRPVIVIATVEGDIHDIGKNLVALMLKNYGYQVYDLGKDVPADTIIAEARKYQAKAIVLSALMTTTMMKMKETIDLRDAYGLDAKVMIGGAVTSQSFADEIGADGWSGDAADAVRLAQRLL